MDLYIQTLTGTTFELRVSPFETLMSIKAKIQRLEGIPISQQHLIWRSVELEDDYCLHDYNICDGATLKLVLAMRGGPINTRRIPMEDPTLREMAEYMEANRDEIWDKLPKDNRQVTLLVFRDGDQLNFFRVVDRGDGTLTPLSDSLSGASMYNLYDEEEEENQPPISQETVQENNVTMNKMKLLRNRMLTQKSGNTKPKMQPRPPSGEKPSSSMISTRRRLHLSSASPKKGSMDPLKLGKGHPKPLIPHPPTSLEASMAHGGSTSKGKEALPPVNTKKGKQIDVSDFLAHQQEPKVPSLNRTLTRSAFREGRRSITEFVNESKEIKPLGSISKNKGRSSSPRFGDSLEHSLGSASIRRSKIPEDVGVTYRGELSADSAGYRRTRVGLEARIPTPEGHHSSLLNDSLSYSHRHLHDVHDITEFPPSHHLPPVKSKPPPQLVPTKKKTRCFFCGKKTGLATTYQCRCGNSFCATHRYAEVHSCTYDYKSEGRKIIEQNNPVIAAPKLPKI